MSHKIEDQGSEATWAKPQTSQSQLRDRLSFSVSLTWDSGYKRLIQTVQGHAGSPDPFLHLTHRTVRLRGSRHSHRLWGHVEGMRFLGGYHNSLSTPEAFPGPRLRTKGLNSYDTKSIGLPSMLSSAHSPGQQE